MAKVFSKDELKALAKMDFPLVIQRADIFPLDASSIFSTKEDAVLYASGGKDYRGLSGTRYAGQLIAVQENDSTVLYTVEANDTLKPVVGAVSEGLADITTKVTNILNGATLDSFKDVEDKFAAIPKDMVVSGGEVRVPTTEEITADNTLVAGEKYIILTIANANAGKDKLYIKAKDLVDVYTGGTYVTVSKTNQIDVNVTKLEEKFVTDKFAKKADITTAIAPLATTEALNAVSSKANANATNIETLTTTVGDANGGLVKKVTDLETSLGNYTTTEDFNTKLAKKVDKTTTINTHALTDNIVLNGGDILVGGSGTHKAAKLNVSVEDIYTQLATVTTTANAAVKSVTNVINDKYVTVTTTSGAVKIASKGIDSAISTAVAGVKVSVTDGGYITGSVDTAGRKITLGSTTQAISSASSTAKGLAEASDVKIYVDNKVSNYAPSTLT